MWLKDPILYGTRAEASRALLADWTAVLDVRIFPLGLETLFLEAAEAVKAPTSHIVMRVSQSTASNSMTQVHGTRLGLCR